MVAGRSSIIYAGSQIFLRNVPNKVKEFEKDFWNS
jgi:hypothetical protein